MMPGPGDDKADTSFDGDSIAITIVRLAQDGIASTVNAKPISSVLPQSVSVTLYHIVGKLAATA